jgi:diphthine-ammonia ligase
MTRVFVSWSGGKDGCLACHRALAGGMDVRYLANMVSADGLRSRSHGIAAAVIKAQAEALGIPIVQRRTADDSYEAEFTKMLSALKEEGITGGVFGDIDFEPHREWVTRVCRQAGMTAYLPLWEEDQTRLMEEFIGAGFVSVVVAARGDFFGPEVPGRKLDGAFLAYLKELGKTKNITPCGEAGEYHTLVVDGPIFRKRLEITKSKHIEKDGIHFLEIEGTRLKNK